MPIHLGIYRPTKGGYGVYIKGVSGLSLEYFEVQNTITNPENLPIVYTKSERLKHTNTLQALRHWITRFNTLPEEHQLSRVGNKSLWVFKPNFIAIRVRYFKLIVDGKVKAVSPRIPELEKFAQMFSDYKIAPSITRSFTLDQSEYDKIKHEIVVLPALPKSKRENQFANRLNSFKVPFNSNLK